MMSQLVASPLVGDLTEVQTWWDLWLFLIDIDEVPICFGSTGKTITEVNAKAVHAVAHEKEAKRIATMDPFFSAEGKLLLPLSLILKGSKVSSE